MFGAKSDFVATQQDFSLDEDRSLPDAVEPVDFYVGVDPAKWASIRDGLSGAISLYPRTLLA